MNSSGQQASIASSPRTAELAAVERALAFIAEHGVVLVSARGAAPRLIDAIAGEVVAGNWWSHPRANAIYRVVAAASESDDVLACRLVGGKVTLVHRRLWPALARLAARFAPEQIRRVRTEHTASGRHVSHELPFAEWLPADVARQAAAIDETDAVAALGRWLPASTRAGSVKRSR
ncbi:MAG TPA: hypothetical protein VH041_03670 [Caldimonas sp.]|jgi:hypothetical protein|nr:hypothetical protein [Caldimonas sp.]HEX4233379.1 hypothetical protein [Caldimonas sp.]